MTTSTASQTHWTDAYVRMDACPEAVEWSRQFDTFSEAWGACERGDWMLWLAGRLDIDRKLIVRAACKCARLALRHVPDGEGRPLKAIETAESWCDGGATIDEVRAAADAAYADAAAYAAYAAADAAYAAYAAADAAYAAADAAYAAYAAYADAAANTAYAAYAAAAANTAAAARKETLQTTADIVREVIGASLVESLLFPAPPATPAG